MSIKSPPEVTFTPSNPRLDPDAVSWVKQSEDGYRCSDCAARGDWMPRYYQGDCPECYGDDEYGQDQFCGECEFCCGC